MVRLGIIGVGGYGRLHVEEFARFQEEGRVRIVALADPSPLAMRVARIHAPDAAAFESHRQLLECDALDAVVIASPVPWHEEMVLDALRREVFVLLEKPPVPLLSQLERLIQADTEGRVMVAFQHIYSQGIWEIKTRLLRGEFGCLERLESWGLWPRSLAYYARAGWAGTMTYMGRPVLDGPCTNAFAHFLNNIAFLAGPSPREYAQPRNVQAELYRARPIEGYDTGCLAGEIGSGIAFRAGFTHACRQEIRAYTQAGTERGKLGLCRDGESLFLPGGEERPTDDGRTNQRRAFLRFTQGEWEANLTPLEASRSYVAMTNLMFQSARRIHTVPVEAWDCEKAGTPEEQYVIRNIQRYLEAFVAGNESLRDAGAAWSSGLGSPQAVESLSEEWLQAAVQG